MRSFRTEWLAKGNPLDFTQGILQSIGPKELEPFIAADEKSQEKLGNQLVQCIDLIKTRTCAYAKKQERWLERKLCPKLEYWAVDTADAATNWDATVRLPVIRALAGAFGLSLSPCDDDDCYVRKVELQPRPVLEIVRLVCEECNGRVIHGSNQIETHLASRGHRRRKKRRKAKIGDKP